MSSSEEISGSSDDLEESESEEEEPPPPPIKLPERSTRGTRVAQLLEDEGSADEEFWNQDFFAEEEQGDAEYNSSNASEAEEPDVVDTDFDRSEEEDSDSEAAEDKESRRRRPSQLKPPGHKKPPAKRPAPAQAKAKPPVQRSLRETRSLDASGSAQAPTLRQSTRRATQDGEKERVRLEQSSRFKKKKVETQEPVTLTQEELLAEAAVTEIENIKSLETMVAQEEEIKKKATKSKKQYTGPMVRFSSKCINGEALTSLEIMNMLAPEELQQKLAPPLPDPVLCVVTGRPARYQDPQTGLPYADLAAFKVLRARMTHAVPRQRPAHLVKEASISDSSGDEDIG
ncbi:hypothetical protein WJX73_002410 [Symbiochloris irregularis]|uniref:Vps72/YL1 C-terminal domain-containing protein n=1 Tax=Symbiochloris irregularis TaxID=706552 RepID=A0AAW1PHN3_9CHLO